MTTRGDALKVTLEAALADVRATRGLPWPARTFGEFVEVCRALGLRDSDPVGMIEVGVGDGNGRVVVERGHDGEFEIREGRS